MALAWPARLARVRDPVGPVGAGRGRVARRGPPGAPGEQAQGPLRGPGPGTVTPAGRSPYGQTPERTVGPEPKLGPHRGNAQVASDHLRILVTRPAPTVRPPSRMAKRRPSSMAMGWIRST